jgi:hypothetical protein
MSSKLHDIVDSVVTFVQTWPVGIAASALIGSFATLAVVVSRKKAEAKILSEIETKSGLRVRDNFWPRVEIENFLAQALTANRKCICVTGPLFSVKTTVAILLFGNAIFSSFFFFFFFCVPKFFPLF